MTDRRMPWRRVLSFLEAVESERTWQGLFARVLQQLESSVPFDYGLAVLVTGNRQVDRQEIVVSHIDDSVLNQYFGRYISCHLYPARGSIKIAERGGSFFLNCSVL
jgi:hypothetical protein